MSHELDLANDGVGMAYVGDLPWHGLGKRVPADLTPQQMLEAADLNWEVKKIPAFAMVAGKKINVNRSALIRDTDNHVLDIVGPGWEPCQNLTAFEFFDDFVSAGDMDMHTAGALKGGQIVWALAKVKESFSLFKGDQVDSYLLFSNPHKFGQSIDVRMTPIRVVCHNTLTLSLATRTNQMVKVSHRKAFDAEAVKETLGIASHKLAQYKEMAKFLGSKRYRRETVEEYFQRVFPVLTTKDESEKKFSKSAQRALDVLETQPGHQYAPGTWWQAANCISYLTDHVIGRSADNRLTSAWYGANKNLKIEALEMAVKYAEAS
jgi:phage/plasmid-like protein (TIGR03299 family)